jgi:hypothetical protein
MKKSCNDVKPALAGLNKEAQILTRKETALLLGAIGCFPPDPRCIKAGRCLWLCP